jgi:hypothetical protein
VWGRERGGGDAKRIGVHDILWACVCVVYACVEYMYTYIHLYMHTHTHTHTHVCVCVCVCVCVHVCVCVCVCVLFRSNACAPAGGAAASRDGRSKARPCGGTTARGWFHARRGTSNGGADGVCLFLSHPAQFMICLCMHMCLCACVYVRARVYVCVFGCVCFRLRVFSVACVRACVRACAFLEVWLQGSSAFGGADGVCLCLCLCLCVHCVRANVCVRARMYAWV